MSIVIESSRLRLRPWHENDFPEFAAYFSDPVMARFVGGKRNKEEAWRLLATYIGHWEMKGYGYWAVEERSSSRFVGAVGLWKSQGWPELELGYWVKKQMQGKGYASEAAQRCLEYAFSTMEVDTVVSYIDPENHSSSKLAERLGGRMEKVIELLEFGPHCVYRYHASSLVSNSTDYK